MLPSPSDNRQFLRSPVLVNSTALVCVSSSLGPNTFDYPVKLTLHATLGDNKLASFVLGRRVCGADFKTSPNFLPSSDSKQPLRVSSEKKNASSGMINAPGMLLVHTPVWGSVSRGAAATTPVSAARSTLRAGRD